MTGQSSTDKARMIKLKDNFNKTAINKIFKKRIDDLGLQIKMNSWNLQAR